MGNVVETITNKFSPSKGCIETLNIYDDHVEATRVGMSSVSFNYRDFSKVDMQPASLGCAYAMIVFLEKDYYTVKFINGNSTYPETNRLYILDGVFKYAQANELATEIVTKLNAAIQRYKQSGGNAPASVLSEDETIATLKQYKELLDTGIITQEEFDAKKKQLLEGRTAATVSPVSPEIKQSDNSSDVVCCPKCGSTEFHSGKRGWNIWTGLLGSSKVIMTCLKCGHKWNPKDYQK